MFKKKKRGPKLEKINPRWGFGIFVGVKRSSNEVLLARPEGIFTARSVHRIVEEERLGIG